MSFQLKHTNFLFSAILLLCVGCLKPSKTMEEMKEYDGPLMVIENMETIYSDSAETKVRLKAARQEELQNGDRQFPNGVKVEFYDGDVVKTVLTANYGRFYKELNKYKVSGDVVIKNLEEEKRLNTEELFWLPAEDRIYVDKSKQVIITTKDGVLHGKGLEAKQDFSVYKILNPTSEGITVK